MTSLLIIANVEKLQECINARLKSLGNCSGVYISLNKTSEGSKEKLEKENISTKEIFFIDCVSREKTSEDVLYIQPNQLEKLGLAVERFIKDINGDKFLIIDALSTLLIYNEENKVAEFVQRIAEQTSKYNVKFIAFSPKTKGEELLNKIFNFFDEVNEEDNGVDEKKGDYIY